MARPVKVKKPIKKAKKKQQELTRLGSALRALGGLGGSAVGSLIGMPAAGASTGSSLGAALSRWLGSGDYTVSQNSLVSSMKASGTIPAMHKDGQTVVIRHREFIGEIRSSTEYTVQYALPLNPGMSSTFPWLSDIAANFQQYRIRGMVFHYIPTSGNAVSSTNNALGSVMLQTSYRATESAPSSKVELLNEYWSTEVVPSETTCHPIECNPAENPFNVQYVRSSNALPVTDNLLMYDLGTTYVATSGQQAGNIVLGDLWVTYEIELKKPVLETNVAALADVAFLRFAGGITSTSYFSTPSGGSPEGGLDVKTDGVRTIEFGIAERGTYHIWFTMFSSGGIAGPASGPTGDPAVAGSCTVSTGPSGIGLSTVRVETIVNNAGSTVNRLTYGVEVFKKPGTIGAVLIPTISTGAGTWTNINLNVYRISSALS